jgi:hypothetical protein
VLFFHFHNEDVVFSASNTIRPFHHTDELPVVPPPVVFPPPVLVELEEFEELEELDAPHSSTDEQIHSPFAPYGSQSCIECP